MLIRGTIPFITNAPTINGINCTLFLCIPALWTGHTTSVAVTDCTMIGSGWWRRLYKIDIGRAGPLISVALATGDSYQQYQPEAVFYIHRRRSSFHPPFHVHFFVTSALLFTAFIFRTVAIGTQRKFRGKIAPVFQQFHPQSWISLR